MERVRGPGREQGPSRLRGGSGNVRGPSLSCRHESHGLNCFRDCFIIVIRHFTFDLKVSIVPGAYPQLLATRGGVDSSTVG